MAVLDTITGADVKVYSQAGPSSYATGGLLLDASADFSTLGFVEVADVDSPTQLSLDGVAGYISTPDAAALGITGDIDLAALVAADDWTPTNALYAITKAAFFNVGGTSYGLAITATGLLQLIWSADGTALLSASSTAATSFTDGQFGLIRVTMDVDDGGGNRVIKFYTKAYDPTVNPLTQVKTAIATWTQLGTTVTTAGTTSIFDSSEAVRIGADGFLSLVALGMSKCRVLAATIRSGIEGTVVADPDFSIHESGTTSFTDAAGRTWTTQDDADINRQLGECDFEYDLNVDLTAAEAHGKAVIKIVRGRYDQATVGNVSGQPAGVTVRSAEAATATTTGSAHTHTMNHDHPSTTSGAATAGGSGVDTGGAFAISAHTHAVDIANFTGSTASGTHTHNRRFEYDHIHSVSAPTVTDVAASEMASATDLRAVTLRIIAIGFGKS